MPFLSLIWGNEWLRLIAACIVTAMVSVPFGVVKGWNWSNAEQLRGHVVALEKASEQKEKLAVADQQRAQKAEADLNETSKALGDMLERFKGNSCKLSSAELGSLHELAASGSRH